MDVIDEVIGIRRIKELIPHRDPFLFIQSARICDENTAEGVAVWEPENPIFAGHFPQIKIVPGVCQIDAAAQLVGIHAVHGAMQRDDFEEMLENFSNPIGVLTGVKNSIFHYPVQPGDRLQLSVDVKRAMSNMLLAKGFGTVRGKKALTFEIRIAIARHHELRLPSSELL
jgi:3-hydroxyacyl-[acyl-carrier-protein] dehydratase